MKASVKVVLATVAISAILVGCGAQPASTTQLTKTQNKEESSVVSSTSAPPQESQAPEQTLSETPKQKEIRTVDEVPQGSGNPSMLGIVVERGSVFLEVKLDPFYTDIEGDIFIKVKDGNGNPIPASGKWTNQLRLEGLPPNTKYEITAQREGIDGKYSASVPAFLATATLREYQDPVHAVFTYDGNKISIAPSDSRLMAIRLLREGDKFTIPEGGHEAGEGYGGGVLIPVENFVGSLAEAAGLKERGYGGIALVAHSDDEHEARWCEAIINIDDLIAKGALDTRDIV